MAAVIALTAIAALTAADQLIKHLVELRLAPVGTVEAVRGVLSWDYVQNTGAAFGSFSQRTTLLSVITGVIILAGILAILCRKIKNKFLLTVAVMILAGGLGNLIDRIFRGYVVDYINVRFVEFPVFNFADILVTCGSFLLVGYLIRDAVREHRQKKNKNEG